MRGLIIAIFALCFATSCDPDVAGEKITLPPTEFAFKVSPDTSVLRIGDTFSIHAGLGTTLNNGIKLEDGHGEIGIFVSRG